MAPSLRPAVFLDRDGTLIDDVGYLADPSEIPWFSETGRALRLLADRFALFVVTNQPGISRGALKGSQVAAVNGALVDTLAREGVRIEEVYVCPHDRSEGCACIKPRPFFLHRAARDHGIDLARSFVVGDHPHDAEFAVAGGARGVYVLTGHGEQHRPELTGAESAVVPGILDATRWILARTWPGVSEAADVDRAARVLRQGGVVAFPTETVYGLGADARNPRAVARVFEIKARPRFDPLIVHAATLGAALRQARDVPEEARVLAERFWPGPLTLVLPKDPGVPDIVTSGLDTVALRVPDHPMALALLRASGTPIAAPSANPFGRISPTRAEDVVEHLAGDVDMVLDGGPCRVGVESTVVAVLPGRRPALLRPGGVPAEALEAAVGPLEIPTEPSGPPSAPGGLPSHYAPRTRLVLDPRPGTASGLRQGLLAFQGEPGVGEFAAVEILSPAGNLREAAASLFGALRRLDRLGLDQIVAEPVPEQGLGRAIMDRLRRAAAASAE